VHSTCRIGLWDCLWCYRHGCYCRRANCCTNVLWNAIIIQNRIMSQYSTLYKKSTKYLFMPYYLSFTKLYYIVRNTIVSVWLSRGQTEKLHNSNTPAHSKESTVTDCAVALVVCVSVWTTYGFADEKRQKFYPLQNRDLSCDRQKFCHRWLRRWHIAVPNLVPIRPRSSCTQNNEMRWLKWRSVIIECWFWGHKLKLTFQTLFAFETPNIAKTWQFFIRRPPDGKIALASKP